MKAATADAATGQASVPMAMNICTNPVYKKQLTEQDTWTRWTFDEGSGTWTMLEPRTDFNQCEVLKNEDPGGCLQCMAGGPAGYSTVNTDYDESTYTFCNDCCTENPDPWSPPTGGLRARHKYKWQQRPPPYNCNDYQGRDSEGMPMPTRPAYNSGSWNKVTCQNACPSIYGATSDDQNWCMSCCVSPEAGDEDEPLGPDWFSNPPDWWRDPNAEDGR